MKTASLMSIVSRSGDTAMASRRRLGIRCVPPLLAVLGVCSGIGLGALASGAEFRSGAPFAAAARPTDVEVLPRVVVTPHGARQPDPASPALETCTRLHC
jgi:hypothetical protein